MTTPTPTTAAPRRGRPPRVSPEAILAAVNAKTGSGWTMASIAAELGVSEPAIYYHFPSKQDLLTALSAQAIADLRLPAPTSDWQAWLTDLAHVLTRCYREHPFMQDLDMARVAAAQPASNERLEQMLGQLVDCGFSVESATTALVLVLMVVQTVAAAPTGADAVAESAEWRDLALESRNLLAAQAHAGQPASDHLTRLLPVVLAGIESQLAPTTALEDHA